jgi:hypothetical protein
LYQELHSLTFYQRSCGLVTTSRRKDACVICYSVTLPTLQHLTALGSSGDVMPELLDTFLELDITII